jgi:N-acetylglutamate synthase/N-acetylornithine aminotransferase
MIDWSDSSQLAQFSYDTTCLAAAYKNTRIEYSRLNNYVENSMNNAFNSGKIDRSWAYEKCLVMLMDDQDFKNKYENMKEAYNRYKGLEIEVRTREGFISLTQSLIKNRIMQG